VSTTTTNHAPAPARSTRIQKIANARAPFAWVLLIVWALLPWIVTDAVFLNVITLSMVWAFWALSLNIVWGFAGQFSMAQVAIGGLAAYTYAILATSAGWPALAAIVLGIVLSVVVSILIALLCLRLEGFRFAIMTLAFALAGIGLASSLDITGGPSGITVPTDWPVFTIGSLRWDTAGVTGGLAFTGILVFFVLIALLAWFLRSKSGRAFLSIREDSLLAESLGVNPPRMRVLAFAIGGVAAGVAGVYQVQYYAYAYPTLFSFSTLVNMIVVVVLGGPGRLYGPLVGGIVYATLSVGLPIGGDLQAALFGAAIIVITIFAREGLAYYLGIAQHRVWRGLFGMLSRSRRADEAGAPANATSADVTESSDRVGSRDLSSQPVVLSGTGLQKSFGGVTAVKDMHFAVHEGEIFGLIGPNGAGKTTAFNLITGFTRPDKGSVEWLGADVTRVSPSARARAGLVRTFQQPRTFPKLTVRENMVIAAQSAGETQDIDGVLADFGLAEEAETLAGRLSYGHSKRLGVALAAAAGAKMLMLDEPAAGLNAADIKQLMADLVRLRDQGRTIWLVEHHMDVIMHLCDRVMVLDAGAMITTGAPDDVVADPRVIEAYLGGGRDEAA